MRVNYRVYIRYGKQNCVRFTVPTDGDISNEALKLFGWVRDPSNIRKLRNGLQYIYEIYDGELVKFLESKLRADVKYMKQQVAKYSEGGLMLEAFRVQRRYFESNSTSVTERLDFLANTTEISTISPTDIRRRSDGSGWLYLIDLEQEALEFYGFRNTYSPGRLRIDRLYAASPTVSPGFYLKLRFSELGNMSKSEFMATFDHHGNDLNRIWKRNAALLQTVPHADNLPYSVLYGGTFGNSAKSEAKETRIQRLKEPRLTKILASMNRRPPSSIPFLDHDSRIAEEMCRKELAALNSGMNRRSRISQYEN
ncbi:hypothetical protein F5Y16DRAFT_362540 [Xylariaceae sp. FL0255]|nr:hypothetical protein F5Y16DRAFT_362540 [Xylariaceae sp. FL0255]